MHTTYLLSAPVDKGGSLNVRLEQGVDRVFLWQLAVHGNHGPLQYQVCVAKVRYHLVNADRLKKYREDKCQFDVVT